MCLNPTCVECLCIYLPAVLGKAQSTQSLSYIDTIKVLYSAHISTNKVLKALIVYTFIREYRLLKLRILRPNHATRVYKVLRHIQQPKPGTSGRTPSLFHKCTGFFYMRYTPQCVVKPNYYTQLNSVFQTSVGSYGNKILSIYKRKLL